MKASILFLTTLLTVPCLAQNAKTFKIEDLSKPDKILLMQSSEQIFRRLILSDVKMSEYEIKQKNIDFPFNIIANSNKKDSLVSFGYHSFFNGMYQAYADHRPFVLSPDMIWLLISQGFARHVNNNPEQLRKYFVDFSDKVSLTVLSDKIALNDPDAPWETIFPEFTSQIRNFTGKELVDALACNFSTSTNTTRVASEITIMEAMKPYFDFIVIYIVCGIPEITLEGTTEDWQNLLKKTEYLRKYQLDWWIDEIEPVLKEIIRTSKGNIDKSFWMDMFKYHTQSKYGEPNIIDGWIVKFFPYNKDGKRNTLTELAYRDNLPNEIVKVDLRYVMTDGVKTSEIPLELWAGFIGLKQDPLTFRLTPQIGWMIRKKDVNDEAINLRLKLDNIDSTQFGHGIAIRVKSFPKELFQFKHIGNLEIEFIDEISVPDSINKIKIDNFRMTGKISKTEIERVKRLLPKTTIIINRKLITNR